MTAAAEVPGAQLRVRRMAIGALGVWGLVHIVGGAALIAAGFQGATLALTMLGTGLTRPPGPIDGTTATAVEGLVQFHGLNVLLGGIAVTVLAWRARTSWTTSVAPALLVVAALDLGLVVFLLAPGVMAIGDGLPGPVLLVVALAAVWRVGVRPAASG